MPLLKVKKSFHDTGYTDRIPETLAFLLKAFDIGENDENLEILHRFRVSRHKAVIILNLVQQLIVKYENYEFHYDHLEENPYNFESFCEMGYHKFFIAQYQDGTFDYDDNNENKKVLYNGQTIGRNFSNILGEPVGMDEDILDELFPIGSRAPLYGSFCTDGDNSIKREEIENLNFCINFKDNDTMVYKLRGSNCVLYTSYETDSG